MSLALTAVAASRPSPHLVAGSGTEVRTPHGVKRYTLCLSVGLSAGSAP